MKTTLDIDHSVMQRLREEAARRGNDDVERVALQHLRPELEVLFFVRQRLGFRTDATADALVDHHAVHDFGAGQYTGLHDEVFLGVAVQRGLHQSKIEVQAAVALDEVDDVLHALTDTVTDDQQQELAAFAFRLASSPAGAR